MSTLLIGVNVYWPGSVSVAMAATLSRSVTSAKHRMSPCGSGVGGFVHVTSLGSRSVVVSRYTRNCASASSDAFDPSSSPDAADRPGGGRDRARRAAAIEKRHDRSAAWARPYCFESAAPTTPAPFGRIGRIDHDGPMRVLFATAELAPVATVGGLAQAAAGLVGELRRPAAGGAGIDVDVVMPDYGGIELANETMTPLDVPGVGRAGRAAPGRAPEWSDRWRWCRRRGSCARIRTCRPNGDGWPDNDAALPRLLPCRRRARHAPSVPTCCTSTTGTPVPRSPPSTARSRACSRCTTSPTRA